MSERSDTDDSVFMIWTVPTSLLAAAGLFYTLAAVAIVGYKYTMFISQGDDNQVRYAYYYQESSSPQGGRDRQEYICLNLIMGK